jgi:hypothetical protein
LGNVDKIFARVFVNQNRSGTKSTGRAKSSRAGRR